MSLRKLQESWDEFGRTDPLWSIVTFPQKKGGKWEPDEFFATGEREITVVMDYLGTLDVELAYDRALDFGCGVGRLSQALAAHFDEVVGVDIAPSMIELAKKYNRQGGRCTFVLNESDDLELFDDGLFDFIYSSITLQHIEPRYSKNYIREFLRLIRPRGVIVFQLPCAPAPTVRQAIKQTVPQSMLELYRWLRHKNGPRMETHTVPRDEVNGLVRDSGGEVVDVVEDEFAGRDWISLRYCITKRK